MRRLAVGAGFVVFVLPFGGAARQAPHDPWLGEDKLRHFFVSAVIQGTAHGVLRANGHDYGEAAWTAGAVTMTVGVGKEMWDARRGRMFSWKDLVADGAGGATGAVVMRQVNP
jgi:putative lipoprotein